MKTSLWIVVVVVSGMVGFLTGYSASSSKSPRSIERAQAVEEEKVAPHPPETPGGQGAPEGGHAAGEPASPVTPPGSPPPEKTAVPKKAAAARSPKKPAGAKAASAGPSQDRPASPAGGY
jgi:hypothetical protein